MVEKEFEGKTKEEAIDKAIAAMGLDRDEIDVEVVESVKPGFLFRGGKVRIRVHVEARAEDDTEDMSEEDAEDGRSLDEHLETISDFVESLVQKMGLEGSVEITTGEENRLILDIESPNSAILIGRQGKTLEAIQLIVNIAAGRLGERRRIIVDTEDYRRRRERKLVSLAQKVAEQVRRTGDSRTLEAMNPFERRLIHTSLNDLQDIDTVSEGEGLYKRIRVLYTGPRKNQPQGSA